MIIIQNDDDRIEAPQHLGFLVHKAGNKIVLSRLVRATYTHPQSEGEATVSDYELDRVKVSTIGTSEAAPAELLLHIEQTLQQIFPLQ